MPNPLDARLRGLMQVSDLITSHAVHFGQNVVAFATGVRCLIWPHQFRGKKHPSNVVDASIRSAQACLCTMAMTAW